MNKSDFFASMHTLTGCAPEATQVWIDFAAECIDAEQYADFISLGNAEADMARWLDALYAGFCQVRERFGPEMVRQVADLSLTPCCLYPYEMMQAAECLHEGGNAGLILEKVNAGEFDGEPPFFCIALHPLTKRDCGPDVDIQQKGVPYGYPKERIEPGYLLRDGTALLERERDATGCYIGGAGMDGVYLKTGQLYRPIYSEDVHLLAFRPVRPAPENYLATAEMGAEQNYNQIDGIINNEPPKHSLLDQLKQCQEAAGQQASNPPHGQAHDQER